MATKYRLYYWPFLQGRGEFVRLVLEDVGASYVDVARLPKEEGGCTGPILELLRAEDSFHLAPPILQADDVYLSQTANICFFLGQRHGLLPEDTALQFKANQLQMGVTDLVAEVHDTHHPIGTGLYYEDLHF